MTTTDINVKITLNNNNNNINDDLNHMLQATVPSNWILNAGTADRPVELSEDEDYYTYRRRSPPTPPPRDLSQAFRQDVSATSESSVSESSEDEDEGGAAAAVGGGGEMTTGVNFESRNLSHDLKCESSDNDGDADEVMMTSQEMKDDESRRLAEAIEMSLSHYSNNQQQKQGVMRNDPIALDSSADESSSASSKYVNSHSQCAKKKKRAGNPLKGCQDIRKHMFPLPTKRPMPSKFTPDSLYSKTTEDANSPADPGSIETPSLTMTDTYKSLNAAAQQSRHTTTPNSRSTSHHTTSHTKPTSPTRKPEASSPPNSSNPTNHNDSQQTTTSHDPSIPFNVLKDLTTRRRPPPSHSSPPRQTKTSGYTTDIDDDDDQPSIALGVPTSIKIKKSSKSPPKAKDKEDDDDDDEDKRANLPLALRERWNRMKQKENKAKCRGHERHHHHHHHHQQQQQQSSSSPSSNHAPPRKKRKMTTSCSLSTAKKSECSSKVVSLSSLSSGGKSSSLSRKERMRLTMARARAFRNAEAVNRASPAGESVSSPTPDELMADFDCDDGESPPVAAAAASSPSPPPARARRSSSPSPPSSPPSPPYRKSSRKRYDSVPRSTSERVPRKPPHPTNYDQELPAGWGRGWQTTAKPTNVGTTETATSTATTPPVAPPKPSTTTPPNRWKTVPPQGQGRKKQMSRKAMNGMLATLRKNRKQGYSCYKGFISGNEMTLEKKIHNAASSQLSLESELKRLRKNIYRLYHGSHSLSSHNFELAIKTKNLLEYIIQRGNVRKNHSDDTQLSSSHLLYCCEICGHTFDKSMTHYNEFQSHLSLHVTRKEIPPIIGLIAPDGLGGSTKTFAKRIQESISYPDTIVGKYRGVYPLPGSHTYMCVEYRDGVLDKDVVRLESLGVYDNELEAALVYDSWLRGNKSGYAADALYNVLNPGSRRSDRENSPIDIDKMIHEKAKHVNFFFNGKRNEKAVGVPINLSNLPRHRPSHYNSTQGEFNRWRLLNVGTFRTETEAARVYNLRSLKRGGEDVKLNHVPLVVSERTSVRNGVPMDELTKPLYKWEEDETEKEGIAFDFLRLEIKGENPRRSTQPTSKQQHWFSAPNPKRSSQPPSKQQHWFSPPTPAPKENVWMTSDDVTTPNTTVNNNDQVSPPSSPSPRTVESPSLLHDSQPDSPTKTSDTSPPPPAAVTSPPPPLDTNTKTHPSSAEPPAAMTSPSPTLNTNTNPHPSSAKAPADVTWVPRKPPQPTNPSGWGRGRQRTLPAWMTTSKPTDVGTTEKTATSTATTTPAAPPKPSTTPPPNRQSSQNRSDVNPLDTNTNPHPSSAKAPAAVTSPPHPLGTTTNPQPAPTNPLTATNPPNPSTTEASGLISLETFQRFWFVSERNLGYETQAIEHSSDIRSANRQSSRIRLKQVAQYGRIYFEASQTIFRKADLKQNEIFMDIGHGIGNAPLLAAYIIGCESRGIEIDHGRHHWATKFEEMLEQRAEIREQKYNFGRIELREGSLIDPQQKSFIMQSDVIMFNNAEDCFGSRSDYNGPIPLDTYVGMLFASMKPNTRLITLYPLFCLENSLEAENAYRKENGMDESPDASFFSFEKIELGTNVTTWTDKPIVAYMYTRVFQSPNLENENLMDHHGYFLCYKKKCPGANKFSRVVDWDDSNPKINTCLFCDEKRRTVLRSGYGVEEEEEEEDEEGKEDNGGEEDVKPNVEVLRQQIGDGGVAETSTTTIMMTTNTVEDGRTVTEIMDDNAAILTENQTTTDDDDALNVETTDQPSDEKMSNDTINKNKALDMDTTNKVGNNIEDAAILTENHTATDNNALNIETTDQPSDEKMSNDIINENKALDMDTTNEVGNNIEDAIIAENETTTDSNALNIETTDQPSDEKMSNDSINKNKALDIDTTNEDAIMTENQTTADNNALNIETAYQRENKKDSVSADNRTNPDEKSVESGDTFIELTDDEREGSPDDDNNSVNDNDAPKDTRGSSKVSIEIDLTDDADTRTKEESNDDIIIIGCRTKEESNDDIIIIDCETSGGSGKCNNTAIEID